MDVGTVKSGSESSARLEEFVKRVRLPVSAEMAFKWHARPGAFERVSPPWEAVRVVERSGEGIADGSRIMLEVRVGPFCQHWIAEHCDFRDGEQFRDVQRSGPFAHWDHVHRFEADGPDGCFLEDRIAYALPGGSIGHMLGGRYVRDKLERTFAYRHRLTRDDLAAHANWKGAPAMNVLVSGSTGLVGSALVPFLTAGGHQVTPLVRSTASDGKSVRWDPSAGTIDAAGLEGFDAVVHLAGENVASRRWNAEQKARIRDSRVKGTRLLCEALAKLDRSPRVLVCASAVGFYGDRGDEVLTEESQPGMGFLSDVCREWEDAARPAIDKGIRVVHLRYGVILSPKGGALAKMLTPFRMGVGGVVGSGKQYMPWVSLDDAIGATHHALMDESLRGPVNVVAPHPATNLEFTKTLGRVLWRPTIFPMPAFAARLAFGEMADALLLASTRVEPRRLLAAGYAFRYPQLEDALRFLLGKPG
jgi:uncharacterized protein (TIGR01777 family)